MHRLSSPHDVTRFKLASWGLVMMSLLIVTTLGMTACAFVIDDLRLMQLALCLIVLSGVMALVQWLLSSRARCPLCRSQAIARDTSSKHRSAKRLFGSYRLQVAATIIFMKNFRCPYCGEPTSVEAHMVRRSRGRSR